MSELYQIIMVVVGLLAAGGFSHGVLSSRISLMEKDLANKVDVDDVRQIMDDKLEAHKAEFRGLTQQVKELKTSVKELNDTIRDLLRNGFQKGNS